MIRWIAFDDDTAEAVLGRFKRGATEIQQGDPIRASLDLKKPSVLVLQASTPGKVLLACIRPAEKSPISPSRQEIAFEPTGFLGLSDAPVTTQDLPSTGKKKKWWQRKAA